MSSGGRSVLSGRAAVLQLRNCQSLKLNSPAHGVSHQRQLHVRSAHNQASKQETRRPLGQKLIRRRSVVLGSFMPCCCGLCKPKDGWYDRFFAWNMANGMQAYEEAISARKYALLSAAVSGAAPKDVLEVGIGAGPNLLPLTSLLKEAKVTGVDPNPFMFEYARDAAANAGLPGEDLRLLEGVAEALPLPDASFDLVICTLVLCSVPSVPGAVSEMKRVLRPGGRLVFLEHVLAPAERPLLRLVQQVLNPIQQLLADGCHLNRNPLPAIQAAGFESVEASVFDVEGMGPIAPHVAGIAAC